MPITQPPRPDAGRLSVLRQHWPWLIAVGCLLVILIAILLPPAESGAARRSEPVTAPPRSPPDSRATAHSVPGEAQRNQAGALTPEEIVATKVTQFSKDRLRILRAMAKHFKVDVPEGVEEFYEAAAAGKWTELHAAFQNLHSRRQAGEEGLKSLWGPILETELISECAHEWPAQKLLDYGNSILGSLRPGMVYVGGTDPGRGIPTLLNETSEGERHVVLTQNALADATYLQYVNFLYGEQLSTLNTEEDSQRAFSEYIADAQKRLAHDQQFPDEPKQLRPGEDVRLVDGRVEVSGQVAVMMINERLLTMLMDKNPNLSFALEESFPLNSTYPNAAPLGPIMELRVDDVQNSFTPERADEVLQYWQSAAGQVLADAQDPEGSTSRKTYSKLIAAQANLLASHDYASQAEQAYRLASQIEPDSPEATYGLAALLARAGRGEEASQLLAAFGQRYPAGPER